MTDRKRGVYKMPRGRPKAYTEVEVMQQKIDKYFKECYKNKEPYTVTGLCLALDITRETLSEYSKKDEFSDTIKKAKLKVENYLEKSLITTGPATGIIFNLKNNFGWKDKQEIEHSGEVNNPFKNLTTEELRQLIKDE